MGKNPEDSYDMNFFINDILKEVAVNSAQMKAGIKLYEKNISVECDLMEKAKLLSKSGFYHNTVDQHDESEKNLTEAIRIFQSSKFMKGIFIAMIRIARTFQYKNQMKKALSVLFELEKSVDDNPELESYRDFIFQHRGKVHFDMKHYNEAMECFSLAMNIRKKKGDSELIESTQIAIDAVIKKLSGM